MLCIVFTEQNDSKMFYWRGILKHLSSLFLFPKTMMKLGLHNMKHVFMSLTHKNKA